MVCGLALIKCVFAYRWKSAQTKGRQAEIELCNRLFLKRNVLLDIDVSISSLRELYNTSQSLYDNVPASLIELYNKSITINQISLHYCI